jgi:hypothetical protein
MTTILRACHHARVRTFIVAAVMLAIAGGATADDRFAVALVADNDDVTESNTNSR